MSLVDSFEVLGFQHRPDPLGVTPHATLRGPKPSGPKPKSKPKIKSVNAAAVKPKTQTKGKSGGKRKIRCIVPNTPPAYSEVALFREATSDADNVAELVVSMTVFEDITGDTWKSFVIDPKTLPGYAPGSSAAIISCTVDVLQLSNTKNHATNNVMVLGGVGMSMVPESSDFTFCAGKQTIILPSSVPKFVRVAHIPFEKLRSEGYDALQAPTSAIEVARFALVNPDNGALSQATTLQGRFVVRYAVSIPLASTCSAGIVPLDAIDDLTPQTAASSAVYAVVTGTRNVS